MTPAPHQDPHHLSLIRELENKLQQLCENARAERIASDDAFDNEQYLTATQHYWNSESLRRRVAAIRTELAARTRSSRQPPDVDRYADVGSRRS